MDHFACSYEILAHAPKERATRDLQEIFSNPFHDVIGLIESGGCALSSEKSVAGR